MTAESRAGQQANAVQGAAAAPPPPRPLLRAQTVPPAQHNTSWFAWTVRFRVFLAESGVFRFWPADGRSANGVAAQLQSRCSRPLSSVMRALFMGRAFNRRIKATRWGETTGPWGLPRCHGHQQS